MSLQVEVFNQEPEGFSPQFQVAACYLEIEGKLLLLQQSEGKEETGAWGLPAGKMETHETPREAARREFMEETGIINHELSQFLSMGCFYIRKPTKDYVFHVYQLNLPTLPTVKLTWEHQAYRWFSREELNRLPLMLGAQDVLLSCHTKNLSQKSSWMPCIILPRSS